MKVRIQKGRSSGGDGCGRRRRGRGEREAEVRRCRCWSIRGEELKATLSSAKIGEK
jgi:hypothetical protein